MKHEVVDNAVNIPGFMCKADLLALYELGQKYIKPGGFAIEVGSWKGQSTYVIASVCKEKGAILYAIDTFAGVEKKDSFKNDPTSPNNYFEAVNDPNFHKILLENTRGLPIVILKGDSQEIHKYLPDFMFDFCFIDGNHNSPVVDNDIKNYLEKVRLGGMLCGHDHGNPETDVHWAVERMFGLQTVGSYKNWDLYADEEVIRSTTNIWCHEI